MRFGSGITSKEIRQGFKDKVEEKVDNVEALKQFLKMYTLSDNIVSDLFVIKCQISFEGFYGRASEDNETQYTIKVNDLGAKIKSFEMKSQRFETLDSLAEKVLDKIKSMVSEYNDKT